MSSKKIITGLLTLLLFFGLSGSAISATIYGDFASSGLWKYDGSAWTQLTTINPILMASSGPLLYGDFGPPYGIYKYNGVIWSQLTASSACEDRGYRLTPLCGFWRLGVWMYNGSSWHICQPFHRTSQSRMRGQPEQQEQPGHKRYWSSGAIGATGAHRRNRRNRATRRYWSSGQLDQRTGTHRRNRATRRYWSSGGNWSHRRTGAHRRNRAKALLVLRGLPVLSLCPIQQASIILLDLSFRLQTPTTVTLPLRKWI